MVQKLVWKILLVDDDEDDYLLTRQMLSLAQGKDIQLEWVSTVADGYRELTTGHYDAALIDYDLGAQTGLELIQLVDPPNFTVPLILLTGRGGYDVDLEAMQAGASLYLTKSEATPQLLDRSIRYAIERKQTEMELKRTRQELEQHDLLIELSYEPIFIYDFDHGIVDWNQGCEQLYGYPKEEAIGKVSHDLLQTHPDPRKTFLESLLSQGYWTGELRHQAKDGREVIVESRHQLVETNGRRLVLETNRDITQRKQSEQALNEAFQKVEWMARFPEENPNPVVRASMDGNILYCNPPAARLEGWKCVVGQPISPALMPLIARAASQGSEVTDDMPMNGKYYSVSVVPLLDKGYVNIYGRDIAARKLAEQALAQSEMRWSTTLASIGDGVLATDAAGNVQFMNTVAEELTGWALAEALHKPVSEVFHIISEVTRQTIEDPVAKVFERGVVVGLANHTLLVRKDGHEIGIDDSGAPIRDASGKVDGAVLVFRDITERRLKEDQFARLSQLYATLSQVNEAIVRAQDAMDLCNEMCRIISEGGFPLVWIGEVRDGLVAPVAACGSASGYMQEIKVTVDGELGQGPTGTCIREDHPVVNADFGTNPATLPWREAALRYGIRSSAAFPLRRHGEPVGALTLYSALPGRFDQQQVSLLEQLSIDISYAMDALEQEQAIAQTERALRLSENRYRSLFESMQEGFYLGHIHNDENGKPFDFEYLEVNPAYEKIIGRGRDRIIGKTARELVPNLNQEFLETFSKVELTGEPGYNASYSVAFGRYFETFVFRPAVGQFAVIVTDVTERKQAEEAAREADRLLKEYAQKLERSNRELQDFASIASHDLQEPLRKVKSFGDLLQASLAGRLSDQEKSFFERMINASGRMQNLIDALLAYSRVSTKSQLPHKVNLGQLAAEVVSSMDAEIGRLGARVEIGPLPEIEADAVQMRQLLQNLLSNALKFHRTGVPPLVQVCARAKPAIKGKESDIVCIEVKDNGIGFDTRYLDRIFQPFERLHGRNEYEGTGMGLPICKKIVERHQGTITAHSVLGEGSTFIVTLPKKQTV
jgi:PAS domain S-box-containing protein